MGLSFAGDVTSIPERCLVLNVLCFVLNVLCFVKMLAVCSSVEARYSD